MDKETEDIEDIINKLHASMNKTREEFDLNNATLMNNLFSAHNINNNLTSRVNETMESINPFSTYNKADSSKEEHKTPDVNLALENWLNNLFYCMNNVVEKSVMFELDKSEIDEIQAIKKEKKGIKFADRLTGSSKKYINELMQKKYQEMQFNHMDKNIEIGFQKDKYFAEFTDKANLTELLFLTSKLHNFQNQISERLNELEEIAQRESLDLDQFYNNKEDFEFVFGKPSRENIIRREYHKLNSQNEILTIDVRGLDIIISSKKLLTDMKKVIFLNEKLSGNEKLAQKLGKEVFDEINSITSVKLEENIFEQLKNHKIQLEITDDKDISI